MTATYNKLSIDHQNLKDQYQSDKVNWERQSQEVKVKQSTGNFCLKAFLIDQNFFEAPAQKSISVVSAMPTPATDRYLTYFCSVYDLLLVSIRAFYIYFVICEKNFRPSIIAQESRTTVSVRPSRPTRTVVSIPPITTPRSTVTVPPTAVSPGPSYPDQSLLLQFFDRNERIRINIQYFFQGSSGQISLQGSSVNVTSSSNNQTSSSTVPHAFVSPHIESSLSK